MQLLEDYDLDTGEELPINLLPELTNELAKAIQINIILATRFVLQLALHSLVQSSFSASLDFLGPAARCHICHPNYRGS